MPSQNKFAQPSALFCQNMKDRLFTTLLFNQTMHFFGDHDQ